MEEILESFAAGVRDDEEDVLVDVTDYLLWRDDRQPGSLLPGDNDDVDIRTYLHELRAGGASPKTVRRKIAALERLYVWAAYEKLIEVNPFDEYSFDRPVLNREHIRRRPDAVGGDQQTREIARLRALHDLADQLNRSTDAQAALEATLDVLLQSLGLQTAWAFLWTEAGLPPHLAQAPAPHDFVVCGARGLPPGLQQDNEYYLREPPDCHCQLLMREGHLKRAVNIVECTRLQDSADDDGDTQGLLFHASVPLISQGRPFGILNVATDEWQLLGAADLQLLSAAGAQTSITLERARLFALSQELGAAEERMRLAREIHDTLAQGLAGIALNLETADALLDAGAEPASAQQSVRRALAQAHASLAEARRSVLDLRAGPLEGRTLGEALAALAAQCGDESPEVEINFIPGDLRPLAPRLEEGLFRIAQEALANALRHAAAQHINLELTTAAGEAQLTIEDDGQGFDPARVPAGRFGLIGLSERARLLGGTLRLQSSPGEGTRVEVVVPNQGAAGDT